MHTVHEGLRNGELEKDTYQRLTCAACELQIERERGHGIGTKIYYCPECDRRWER